MIWDEANKGRQAETPDNHLARFIGRRYLPLRKDCRVLDIGPGRHGANQTYLENKGFQVVSIDLSNEARANIHGDIRTHEFQPEEFDLIIDINTLCHVDDMDYSRLQSWLKPQGRFFSVMPADGTWMEQLGGKGFCLVSH